MAGALMMFMAMEEEDKNDKNIIISYHKKEKLIRENIMLHQKDNVGVSYGIMYFNTYRIRGVNITDYRILLTTNNLDTLNNHLAVITTFLSEYDIYYLIYKVSGVNANLLSYDVVMSSTFPNVTMKVHKMSSVKLVTFTGNEKLCNRLLIPCLTDYNNYANKLRTMKKKEVKKLLDGWCFIYTKRNIIRLILINEKRKLKKKIIKNNL